MRTLKLPLILLTLGLISPAFAGETTITVHVDQPIQPSNKCLTGVCIEDVNHEIYGGLYSQMIFGESFQEPPSGPVIAGFRAYGGNWTVSRDQVVDIDGADGPKLVSDHAPFANGTVSVELQFADRAGENAGLLVCVSKPAAGADAFSGYEVSLDPARQAVRLGRHQGNYELIEDTPCDVPVGQWVSLQIKLSGSLIEITVDGKRVLRHDEGVAALSAGTVALRAWRCKASFRNLSLKTGGQLEQLPFVQIKGLGEVSGMWQPIVHGNAVARFALNTDGPFIGLQSQQLEFESGEGEVGIENQGLNHWGMNVVAGKPYEGCVWVRADKATTLVATLESGDGSKDYAEQSLSVSGGDWQRINLALTPSGNDRRGRFALKLKQPGSVLLGHVFIQPGEWGRFKGLPVRRDVAEGLVNQGVTVIRYGGSMVNSPAYKWKNMIGPRDRRPPYAGTWYPYSSNGWGVIDFLNFCQASGVVGIPDLNVKESPQDLADFIEYVNGSAATEWVKRRVADGHRDPYHLRYLELGNEEHVNAAYAAKFTAIADAIWSKDPDIILVVGDFSYHHKITDPDHITGADGRINNLDGQRQILDFARLHGREVWFDVHVWSEAIDTFSDLNVLPTYIDAIDKIADGAKHRVVVFELNANSHGQNRALANAVSINTIKRDNRIPIITSANGLQPDGQNDNGWDQGLLFLNPWQVWLQPPGHVTRMQSGNELPQLLKCDVTDGSHLDVTATGSADGKKMVLQVVNTGGDEAAAINLQGFTPGKSTAHVSELASSSDAVNTADEPLRICPKESEWSHEIKNGRAIRLFPSHSFTVIRFE